MKIRELIKIELYSISNYDLFNYSKQYKKINYHNVFKHLPEYSINDEYGNILETECYHQFTILTDPELKVEKFYTLLDITPISSLIEDEISNSSLDSFLPKMDYNILIDKCAVNSLNDILPVASFIVIDIDYSSDGENISTEIIGFLDSDMILKYF